MAFARNHAALSGNVSDFLKVSALGDRTEPSNVVWLTERPPQIRAGEVSPDRIPSVTLTDATGSVHTYVKTTTGGSAGGYTPPAGEYGVLSLDASGRVVLTDDGGTVYSFNAQGAVQSVTTPADALKPATPIVSYRAVTGQADRISDPLSFNTGSSPATYSREVRFVYAGDTAASVGLGVSDSDMSGTACPVPPGYTAPPAGMLCRIIYPGYIAGQADTTQLYYNAAGQLVRILDPGNEVTDFSYDTAGLMAETTRGYLHPDDRHLASAAEQANAFLSRDAHPSASGRPRQGTGRGL